MGDLIGIADLKFRVKLCSADDVISSEGSISLVRNTIVETWAAIISDTGSLFASNGFAIMEDNTRQTHEIVMRYRRDLDITNTAWIMESRLQSPARWFKILSVYDCDDLWHFKCRLVQAFETAPVAKKDDSFELPPGVRL